LHASLLNGSPQAYVSHVVSRIRKAVAALAALYVLAALVLGVFLAEVSLKHTRQPLASRYKNVALERVNLHHAQLRDVEMQASDGALLRAWYVTPQVPNGQAVILLHGVTDTRLGVAGFGELFLEHGYSILLPDSRNHGESGGNIATYGVLEAADIAEWSRFLKQKNNACVYGFGESMGAGLVLQSLREDPGFCAVIAESPFSDFRNAAYDRISDRSNVPRWLTYLSAALPVEIGIIYARWKYGVDLTKASPKDAIARSTTPVLLIHGLEDRNLLPANSERILQARREHTSAWFVPNAAHCGAWATTGEEFNRRVLTYMAANQSHRDPSAVLAHEANAFKEHVASQGDQQQGDTRAKRFLRETSQDTHSGKRSE
jgi:uncharacterized protein